MNDLKRLEKELDFLAELNALIKIRLALCTQELQEIEKRKKIQLDLCTEQLQETENGG